MLQLKSTIKVALKNFPKIYYKAARAYPYLTLAKSALTNKRGWNEHTKSTISMLKQETKVRGRPVNVTIEPTNICNLACPVCETGAGVLGREDGHMNKRQFELIIDKIKDHTNTLMFYYMGEPFINKDAYEMIRYAKDQGIPFIDTCSNGDAVNPQKIVSCGLDQISFQIGGMTQETHSIYRVNSNINRVMKNMRETIRLKRETGSTLNVSCGFIVMKHNEHEVDLFIETMKEMKVDEYSVVNPCVRDLEQGEKFLTKDKKYWIYDEELYAKGVLAPKIKTNNSCPWLYYSIVIQVNGNVVPCCHDPLGKHIMGNLIEQDLDEIWNNEKYQAFRKKVYGNQKQIDICKMCSSYPMSQLK